MRKLGKIDSLINENLVSKIFLLWFVLMPFGAKIFSFSIGFMTIYPSLVLTLVLFSLIFLEFRNWNKNFLHLSLFLLAWLLFEVIRAAKTGFSPEVLFDLRSLSMQFFVAVAIFNVYTFLSKEVFIANLVQGLRIYVLVLLTFGILECLLGIHFAGRMTDLYLKIPVTNIFLAPLFIYDNPNDFLTCLLFLFLMLLVFDGKLRSKYWIVFLVLIITFAFAYFADSRFGLMLSGFLILSKLTFIVISMKLYKRINWPIALAFCLSLFLILSQKLSFGPLFTNDNQFGSNDEVIVVVDNGRFKIGRCQDLLSVSDLDELNYYRDSVEEARPERSVNVRKNLILNGLEFIKSAPILGIGAGKFREDYNENKIHDTVKVNNPHNFLIEIISQFGIFGWCYFGILGCIFFLGLYRNGIKSTNRWFIYIFVCIPILWMMPSSFLYLEINWLFLPLMLCFLKIEQIKWR